MKAMLHDLKRLLPEPYWSKAWIAGSAAIDPARANDTDVWVLDTPDAAALRAFACAEWDARFKWGEGPHIPSSGRWLTDSNMSSEISTTGIDKFEREGINLVGTGKLGGQDKAIQILSIATPSVHTLLGMFDLSCHAWAIPLVGMGQGPQHYHAVGATLTSELPRVLTFATPVATLARLTTVLTRYGWGADTLTTHPDYERLCGHQTTNVVPLAA